MSKLSHRNIHRTLGYFYVGLIISFSISGIFLNHRRTWHPGKYVSERMDISVSPIHPDSVNDAFIEKLTGDLLIKDKLRRFRVEKGELKVSYEKHDVEIVLETGKGTIETYKKTPVLGQFTQLHQDTNNWWIYYSDVFGLSMAIIAFTGMFLAKGKYGFKRIGWKLALAGIIFPLLFLFLLS